MVYILIIIIIAFVVTNFSVKRSQWYRSQFGDSLKFRHIPRELQIVNLGSNSGKYGFDYSTSTLKGMNWAIGPQALEYDGYVLEQYIDHIVSGGFVLIPICPFSSILDGYTDKRTYDKYHLVIPPDKIKFYSTMTHLKMKSQMYIPLLSVLFYPKSFVASILKRKGKSQMDDAALQRDALRWINGWKSQFGIIQLGDALTEEQLQAISANKSRVIKMINLCQQRGLRPVLVLPPVTRFLGAYFTTAVKQIYIYDFLQPIINDTKTPLLDYMNDASLSLKEYYFNSFFLNPSGAKVFTQRVITDVAQTKEQ